MTDLETIMSDRPETLDQNPPEQIVQEQPGGQPRDEHGRFANQVEPEAPQTQPEGKVTPPPGFVPIQALDERLSKAEERYNAQLREQQAAFQNQMAAFQQQLQRPHEPQAPKVPFIEQLLGENGEAALDSRFQQNVRGAIDPIQHALMFNARLVAENMHGKEKFGAAVEAFDNAVAMRRADPRDIERIRNSPNPFHEAVLWHERNAVLNEVGSDPAAYREKLKQELLEELRIQQPPAQQQTPPVMPTNFAGSRSAGPSSAPAYGGPRPLSDIMGGR